jgi:N-acetyl-gamma-glutamylphosphate reductase
MTKIFATGVTGYLGGDAVYAILAAHPEYEVTSLVRDKTKGAQVAEAHPNIRIVYGDLDDGTLLEEEAANTDIVCSTFYATLFFPCLARVLMTRADANGP